MLSGFIIIYPRLCAGFVCGVGSMERWSLDGDAQGATVTELLCLEAPAHMAMPMADGPHGSALRAPASALRARARGAAAAGRARTADCESNSI